MSKKINEGKALIRKLNQRILTYYKNKEDAPYLYDRYVSKFEYLLQDKTKTITRKTTVDGHLKVIKSKELVPQFSAKFMSGDSRAMNKAYEILKKVEQQPTMRETLKNFKEIKEHLIEMGVADEKETVLSIANEYAGIQEILKDVLSRYYDDFLKKLSVEQQLNLNPEIVDVLEIMHKSSKSEEELLYVSRYLKNLDYDTLTKELNERFPVTYESSVIGKQNI